MHLSMQYSTRFSFIQPNNRIKGIQAVIIPVKELMQVKKKLVFALACVCVFTLSFFLTGALLGTKSEASSAAEVPVETPLPAKPEEPAAEAFIVTSLGGNVVVFRDLPETSPVIVTDIRTESLRRLDREMLETGITVHSHEEALRLLEDLGS